MKLKTRNALTGYLLALPFLIGFAGFYLIPFLWSIRFTFTSGSGGTAFVGLRNYLDIFGSAAFRLAARNTFRFIVIGVPLLMVFSFLLALLLFDKFKGATFFRSLFLYPLVLPAASVVIVVQAFFSDGGLVNQLLSALGLPIEDWIQSEYAFPILVGLYIWKNCGYDLILFLAGLAAIPKEYREAAASEGASYWQVVRYITLPLLIPSIRINVVTNIIGSLSVFDIVMSLTGGEPGYQTETLSIYIMRMCYGSKTGYSTAVAIVMFVIVLVPVLISLRLMKRKD